MKQGSRQYWLCLVLVVLGERSGGAEESFPTGACALDLSTWGSYLPDWNEQNSVPFFEGVPISGSAVCARSDELNPPGLEVLSASLLLQGPPHPIDPSRKDDFGPGSWVSDTIRTAALTPFDPDVARQATGPGRRETQEVLGFTLGWPAGHREPDRDRIFPSFGKQPALPFVHLWPNEPVRPGHYQLTFRPRYRFRAQEGGVDSGTRLLTVLPDDDAPDTRFWKAVQWHGFHWGLGLLEEALQDLERARETDPRLLFRDARGCGMSTTALLAFKQATLQALLGRYREALQVTKLGSAERTRASAALEGKPGRDFQRYAQFSAAHPLDWDPWTHPEVRQKMERQGLRPEPFTWTTDPPMCLDGLERPEAQKHLEAEAAKSPR